MGIALAAHPLSGGKSLEERLHSAQAVVSSHGQKHLLEYFQDEIFAQIPEELHTPFLKLSFVDYIHIDLALRITGVEDIDLTLIELTQENLFIYNLDADFTSFRFHHLFQEFLQARARKIMDDETISAIHRESATFYLERDQIDKALSCYQMAGDYQAMDKLLCDQGLEILAKNRTLTILSLLEKIPQEKLVQYGWLTIHMAIQGSDFYPRQTLPLLKAANDHFVACGDELGELLTLSQRIYLHFSVTGSFNEGATLLPRTEELLGRLDTSLSNHASIFVRRNLAAGYCFFTAEMDKARYYIRKALEIATRHSIRNSMAFTIFIKGYIEMLSGNRSGFNKEAEVSNALMNDPLVGMSNRATLRVLHICYLSMFGDFENYSHQENLIRQSIDDTVLKQTVAAPYFHVWGCSLRVSQGKTEKGLELVNSGVSVSPTARTEHMLSQMLQWQAYIHAIHGNKQSAEIKIGEAAKLRDTAGGPFFISYHLIMAGAIYGRLGKKGWQKTLFPKRSSWPIPSPLLTLKHAP